MRFLILHNDYGTFSGEEHMVSAIGTALEEHGHAVRTCRIRGAVGRGLGTKVATAVWSIFGDHSSVRQIVRKASAFGPDAIIVQNVFPRVGGRILQRLREAGYIVIMRLANYRLFCPVGTAWRSGSFCFKCASSGAHNALVYNCANDRAKSAIYAARHRLNRTALQALDGYIAQSQYQKVAIEQIVGPRAPVKVIRNILSNEQAPVGNEKWNKLQILQVAYVGRRSAIKGFDTFLTLAERMPDVEFHVMAAHEKAASSDALLPGNVVDHGFVDKCRMREILLDCHCLVVPSKWPEGMPNVILDAASSGTAVVVGGIGALPEAVGYGMFGLVVNPPGADAFQMGLEYVRRHPSAVRRMTARAFAYTRRVHSASEYVSRILDFVAEIECGSCDRVV